MNNARRLAAVATAFLTAATLAACGSDSDSGADAGTGGDDDDGWSYTDGSGETVELESTPSRIIADGHAAAALLSFGIKPIGIYANTPIDEDPGLKDLDLEGIEILGETWGEIDVAKAAKLKPDLIVADWWPAEKAYSGVEDGVKEESKKIADLAPMVGASQGSSAVALIEGYEDLAQSLGADLEAADVAAQKQEFEDAVAAFEEANSENPGLTALGVSPTTETLYLAMPKHAPELLDLRRWGLEVIVPDNPDKAFPYWENLAWENADKYQPDLVLVDDRTYPANLRQAERQPTWDEIDAVRRDAVAPWPAYWVHTYRDYAEQLEQMTAVIEEADPEIGSD